MNVTLLGGSGFVGRHLAVALRARGESVTVASLRDVDAAASACARADVVVNLAGAPVAKRWTAAHKEEIRRSRVDLPHELLARIASLARKPGAYVSASAIGYYGTSETATFTESSPPGDDFLARVCVEWEREASRGSALGMRVAMVRCGLILGKDGGALSMMLPAFQLGMGGQLAGGLQWMSWIHVDDAIGVYLLAIDGGEGAYDATAPNPVRNREFTAALGKALHRPTLFPVPAFALHTIFGEGAYMLTEGQRVLPERTLESGYSFKYPSLEATLESLVR